MIDKKLIGKQLRELRLGRGWRQVEVAERVGLSRSAISNLEAGKRSLTLSTLQRFCDIYQIDISYFGIQSSSFDEAVDLVARLESIFRSEFVAEERKDSLYRDIMRLYLACKDGR
ncbi:helix-turn-helix domain-containing protein [Megamonas hypermegale]|uniref:helix-turn-helix domain-containing protein n=1 Tax=Megamonas hypermegale TaxID=158847 RepID=UPI0026F21B29|nr:helix-turn-helix transcriptional regulator [Megamonas hypermegale]